MEQLKEGKRVIPEVIYIEYPSYFHIKTNIPQSIKPGGKILHSQWFNE